MDSNIYNDDESSEEVENDDLGVGRSYECVFCKRGFNTAQALGGHMNIHRRDRAKNKPTATSYASSNNSNKQLAGAENNNNSSSIYTGPRWYHQQIPAPSRLYDNQPVERRFDQDDRDDPRPMQLSCATYFPVVSSASRPLNGNDYDDHREYFRSDDSDYDPWKMRLSLEFAPTMILEDLDKNRQTMDQKEELDLELRLGYES